MGDPIPLGNPFAVSPFARAGRTEKNDFHA
jgi:hypothetical protein